MPFLVQWLDGFSASDNTVKWRTPAGTLVLYTSRGVICRTEWDVHSPNNDCHELDRYWRQPDCPVVVKLHKQGSAYRNRVWAALCEIPFGQTITYAELARKIGSSARAVGNACRDNPYAVIIPCHRVVSVSGAGGYCGQTDGEMLTVKQKLLAFEAGLKNERQWFN